MRSALIRLLSPFALCVLALTPIPSLGQAAFSTSSEIRDTADLFGDDATRKATEQVIAIERKYRIPVTVETIKTLDGEPIFDAAVRHAKRLGPQAKGLFILISKQDRRAEVVASADLPDLQLRSRRNAIRDVFLEEFRKNDYDAGLKKGLEAVEKTFASVKTLSIPTTPSTTKLPDDHAMPGAKRPQPTAASSASTAAAVADFGSKPAEGGKADSDALVVRHRVGLTLAGARKVLSGVESKSKELGYKMNIAIVDEGGHLLAFARMDGARPASANTALTKAVTAATYRQPTGTLPAGSSSPDILLNLSLQNAAAASGGKITTLLGGVPIVIDGQVIGGVGVGGGSGEQDAEVAKAGIAAFLVEMEAAHPSPK